MRYKAILEEQIHVLQVAEFKNRESKSWGGSFCRVALFFGHKLKRNISEQLKLVPPIDLSCMPGICHSENFDRKLIEMALKLNIVMSHS